MSKLDRSAIKGAEDIDIVHTALDTIMNDAFRNVAMKAEELQTTLRLAGYYLAISRVNRYYENLGLTI